MPGSPNGSPVVRLAEPGELLASLPQLIGFRPEDSLVLVADAERGSPAVGPVLRSDLPRPSDRHAAARHLVDTISRSQPTTVIAIVIGGGEPGAPGQLGTPPQLELMTALRAELDGRGLLLAAAFWVPQVTAGSGWRCYEHPECAGTLPDPQSTVAAAAAVDLGLVTFASRDELRQFLAPDADAPLRERAKVIEQQLAAGVSRDEGLHAVRAALRRSRAGDRRYSDGELAGLAVALSDTRIRDACLAVCLPAGSPPARAALELWFTLTRSLPVPHRAGAACLAAYGCYVRGDGALAGTALEAALAADPAHVLAGLLDKALRAGLPPQTVRGLASSSEFSL